MVDKPQPPSDTSFSTETAEPPTWFGMKLRFGIREKFALLAFGLVLAVAIALPTLLFERTRKVVEDHELMDLQDEAELRCWEIIDWVNQARLQVEHCAKDPRELATMKTSLAEFPSRGASVERGEQEWWRHILALEVRPAEGAMQTFHRTRGLPAAEPSAALLAAARFTSGPHIGPIISLLTPAGFDSVKGAANSGSSPDRWQRIPAVWVACRMPSVPETVITMLVSLDRGRSARHLTFVMGPDASFLQHPFVRPDGTEEQIFSNFDLHAESEALTKGEKWGRGPVEAQSQVQRSDRPRFQALQHPLFFLEGRLDPALHEKLVAAHNANRVELLDWTERLRGNMESRGVPFGGASRSSAGIRLLSRNRETLEQARTDSEKAYRDRFGGGANPIGWEAVVPLKHGDVQLTRFFLRHPQHDGATPGGRDFPYYFAYSAFREELASSIAHELQTLRRAGVWLAAGAGVLAFLIVLYFIGPLTRITRTAQTVTRSGSQALQLQNQIEAVRQSLPVRKHDEVGDIARSLESLLRQVLNGHEQLRQLNADLDFRVQEQTAELREANEQLRGLASAKDAFLASVSHELRQPLNSIFGFLQFLELSDPTEEQKHDLAKLRSAATYLRRLIDDILDYQKIIMGGVELDPEDLDATAFLKSLQESMVPQAVEKKNKLELHGAESVGMIYNDRARLQQVLVNLVSNACKFTQNGAVTLAASRDKDATGKDWITIDVSDTGRGMKAEEMQGLFVRFKKLSAREGNKTGTGLGLVISKGLCELMGGTISCRSEFGHGSTFTVRVPAAVPERAGGVPRRPHERPAPAATPGPPPVAPAIPQQTVLVIDDDASVRELMTRYLGGKGYRVITAEDGEKGIVLAREHHPSVITLDVVLPGAQSGWDILAQLKDDPLTASIPVIIVTFLEESRHGFALGAADYVVKPIAWEDLLGSLQKVIRGSAPSLPVLVVDDDPDVRELFRRTLAMDGISIVEAANGAEALTQLRQQRPSLILLDLMMPVMDGFEFIAEFNLHPQWRDIPVIVITAKHVTREDRERLASSVRTVLEKSGFTQEDLLSKVLHLVHQAASEDGKRV